MKSTKASILKYASAVVALAVLSLSSLLILPPLPDFSEPVVIYIEPGTSSPAIASLLESRSIISSRWLFLALRVLRPDAPLMAGEYRFEQPVSIWEAYVKIADGKVMYHPVTVPEGFTRFEVADAVARTGLVKRDEFLEQTEDAGLVAEQFPEAKTLEGFLFPDTYYLVRTATAEDIVKMMTERFRAVFTEVMREATTHLDPYEVVKMASLVEKETSVDAEHHLVSSVFHNRLERGMLLQCDPTVIYGLLLENRFRGTLHSSDLEDPHRYNTYVHAGLPPGPIANPGRKALEAAANPAQSDYLYFVAKANGDHGHVFSRSLRAHNRAVTRYRRSRSR